MLRDLTFAGRARIRTVTAERDCGQRQLADVAGAVVTESAQAASGTTLTLMLPEQSFTVVEAAISG